MYQCHEDYEDNSNTSDYDNEEYNNDSQNVFRIGQNLYRREKTF